MDPKAVLPRALSISSEVAVTAPPVYRVAVLGAAARPPQARKPLRHPKERQPRARSVDEALVVPAAERAAPRAPMAAAPVSSPAAQQLVDSVKDTGVSIPPDTTGAVSHAHIMTATNSLVWIQDRAGNKLDEYPLDDFWDSLHVGGTFDPKLLFDPFEQRFIFVTMSGAETAASSLLIAVSETADPQGNWFLAKTQVDPQKQGDVWLDYPSVGFTNDKITVSVNLFKLAGNAFVGASTYVWDKQALYRTPHKSKVEMFVHKNMGATFAPVATYDAGINEQYVLQSWSGDVQGKGYIAVYRIDGLPANNLTFNRLGYVQIPGAPWDEFGPGGEIGPQKSSAHKLDAGDDRIIGSVMAGGSLYSSQAIYLSRTNPNRSAVLWVELDVAPLGVKQSGRIDSGSSATCYGFPTIAANRNGDLLVGMAVFAKTHFASGGYAHRSQGDPAGTMSGVQLFAPGLNTYHKTFGGPSNRWGDYSATQADPADPLHFWTVQEYADQAQDTWAIRWAKV